MLPQNLASLRSAYLEAMRGLLAPPYQHLGDQEIAEVVRNVMDGMSPDERNAFALLSMQNMYESFWSNIGRGLSNFGRNVSRALPSVARAVAPIAQVAAPVVGGMIGGPAGAMVGSGVGSLLGSLGGGAPRAAAPAATPGAQPGRPAAPSAQANPAASQLMSLLANPQLIQALLGQVMGGVGNNSALVRQAGQPASIPFSALMNTVSELAQRAAEESAGIGEAESTDYLTDAYGNYRLNDPSDTAERADVVMQLLSAQTARQQSTWREEEPESGNDPLTEWLVSAGMIS